MIQLGVRVRRIAIDNVWRVLTAWYKASCGTKPAVVRDQDDEWNSDFFVLPVLLAQVHAYQQHMKITYKYILLYYNNDSQRTAAQ